MLLLLCGYSSEVQYFSSTMCHGKIYVVHVGLADTHNLHDLHKPVILILLCGYSSCKLRGTVFSSHGKICDLYTLTFVGLADHELLLYTCFTELFSSLLDLHFIEKIYTIPQQLWEHLPSLCVCSARMHTGV